MAFGSEIFLYMLNIKKLQIDLKKEIILIRVDSSFDIGGGHLSRCIAFSEYTKKQNFEIIFITTSNETYSQIKLKENCILVTSQNGSMEEVLQEFKHNYTIKCLVSDINYSNKKDDKEKYYNFLKLVKHCGILLITFEIPEEDIFPADCVIIPYVGSEAIRYKHFNKNNYLLGSDYFLLGNDFIDMHKKYEFSSNVNTIMISMGSSDPENITIKILKALVLGNEAIHLDIVLGSMSNISHETISSILYNYPGSWKLHKNPKNLAKIMHKADLAICNNGLTRYELASVGVPTVYISNRKQEIKLSDLFASFGCALHLGWHADLNLKEIASKIFGLIHHQDTRKIMSNRGVELIDGNGMSRVFHKIMSL